MIRGGIGAPLSSTDRFDLIPLEMRGVSYDIHPAPRARDIRESPIHTSRVVDSHHEHFVDFSM